MRKQKNVSMTIKSGLSGLTKTINNLVKLKKERCKLSDPLLNTPTIRPSSPRSPRPVISGKRNRLHVSLGAASLAVPKKLKSMVTEKLEEFDDGFTEVKPKEVKKKKTNKESCWGRGRNARRKSSSPVSVKRARNAFSVSPVERKEILFWALEFVRPTETLWKKPNSKLNESSPR